MNTKASNQMGDRKWEELPVDCLVDIFSRVGLESLVDGVPYVCKSWYKATLSPLCWQSLIFRDDLYQSSYLECMPPSFTTEYDDWHTKEVYSLQAFVNFVIRRSRGTVEVVAFPDSLPLTKEVVKCIGEGCPSLKRLVLPYGVFECKRTLLNMIRKWKDLEALGITRPSLLETILPQISMHCKKFKSLSVMGVEIEESAASAIVELLPNIEFLSLIGSWIEHSNLVMILKGCKKLVHLDVSHCLGFEVDDEILKLAAHIASFNFEGAGVF